MHIFFRSHDWFKLPRLHADVACSVTRVALCAFIECIMLASFARIDYTGVPESVARCGDGTAKDLCKE